MIKNTSCSHDTAAPAHFYISSTILLAPSPAGNFAQITFARKNQHLALDLLRGGAARI
jgi:hypothetical protein